MATYNYIVEIVDEETGEILNQQRGIVVNGHDIHLRNLHANFLNRMFNRQCDCVISFKTKLFHFPSKQDKNHLLLLL